MCPNTVPAGAPARAGSPGLETDLAQGGPARAMGPGGSLQLHHGASRDALAHELLQEQEGSSGNGYIPQGY